MTSRSAPTVEGIGTAGPSYAEEGPLSTADTLGGFALSGSGAFTVLRAFWLLPCLCFWKVVERKRHGATPLRAATHYRVAGNTLRGKDNQDRPRSGLR